MIKTASVFAQAIIVLEINDESVLLGFEANEDFPVQPWEMWERIRAPRTSAIPGDVRTHRRF